MLAEPLHAVRLAVRALARRPGFAIAALLTLALGVGANTAVFSVVDAVLLRPLPYADPARLVAVWPGHFISNAELVALQRDARTFETFAFSPGWGIALSGDGEPQQLRGARTSANFHAALGVRPAIGRGFAPVESQPGRDDVAILSDGLWRARYGADPHVLGRRIVLDGQGVTVIDVMPRGFEFSEPRVDVWLPLVIDPTSSFHTGGVSEGYARLRPGITPARAEAELRSLTPSMREAFHYADDYGHDATVAPMQRVLVGDVRASLLVLFGAVALIVLIATANVGNLLLVRTAERRREIAVRTALGASRARIGADLLVESACLAVAGGALGLASGVGGMLALEALLPADTPRLAEVTLNAPVLATSVLVTALAAILFTLAPAWLAMRTQPQHALRARASDGGGRAGERVRGSLVASEVALAFVLVVGAGLMLRTVWNLSRVDPGFRASGVLTFRLQPATARLTTSAAQRAYFEQVIERVRSVPGVRAVGAIHHLPLDGASWYGDVEVEGGALPPGATRPRAAWRVIAGDYLRAMAIPLRAGRAFAPTDDSGSTQVVLVNETFARRFWPAESPLGKRITAGNATRRGWATVVGVVGDVRHQGLAQAPEPELYRPLAQSVRGQMLVVARVDGVPAAHAAGVRSAVAQVDADVPIADFRALDTVVAASIARPRLLMTLLLAFAAIGLALGAVGVYGVVAYAASQRTREIAVRISLGARGRSIAGLVVGHGARYAAIGLAIGGVAALLATRLLTAVVYGISPTDPATFVGLGALVAGLVVVASLLPARRAARVDPMEALRGE